MASGGRRSAEMVEMKKVHRHRILRIVTGWNLFKNQLSKNVGKKRKAQITSGINC